MGIEQSQRVHEGRGEQIRDGFSIPADGQHLGFKASPFAHRAGHEHVGKELHFDALAAEALAVVATTVAAVERKLEALKPASCAAGTLAYSSRINSHASQ